MIVLKTLVVLLLVIYLGWIVAMLIGILCAVFGGDDIEHH